MSNLQGTQTQKNLLIAFITESQVAQRYTLASKIAKREKCMQVANLFKNIAEQERGHAELFLSFLGNEADMLEIAGLFPAKKLGTTAENLKAFSSVEGHVHGVLYSTFAKTAEEEGFEDIAKAFKGIAIAEQYHEKYCKDFSDRISSGNFFSRSEPTEWYCTFCGYLYKGKDALEKCPACRCPKGYFSTCETY